MILEFSNLSVLDAGLKDESIVVEIEVQYQVEVKEDKSLMNNVASAATQVLFLSTVVKVFTRGSLAELWGAINGI